MDISFPINKPSNSLNFSDPLRAQGLLNRLQNQNFGKSNSTELNNPASRETELKEVAQQFEGMFLHILLKSMRATVPKSGLFKSFAMDQYQSMLDEEIASAGSKQRGLGLSELFYNQFSRLDKQLANEKTGK